MFAGPVGNINGYTSLVLFYACLYTCLYLQEKELRWKHFFMGMMLLCHIATIFGSSDNAVLGYFIVFLLLPFFCWKDNKSFGTCLSVYFLFFLSNFLNQSFYKTSIYFLISSSIPRILLYLIRFLVFFSLLLKYPVSALIKICLSIDFLFKTISQIHLSML